MVMAFVKSAVLVCLNVVLTVYLPRLWTTKRPVITGGTVQAGFEPVAKLFRENFENGVEFSTGGSAYAVYYKGTKVVDIWGGYADSEANRPWKEDTLSVLFSTTKGITSLCMLVLIDRGLIDLETTVASYWPEFAQNGKENVTVRMLLNHQAGLSYTSEKVTLALLEDQDALGEVLARAPLVWQPGTAHGYHSMTFGLYASQLLRRVDLKRRTLGQFFKEEIAQPCDLDVHIGLPLESFHRVARPTGNAVNVALALLYGLTTSPVNRQLLWAMFFGETDLPQIIESSGDTVEFSAYQRPETLALEQPSVFGVGTARAVAKVYGILANGGRTNDGHRLLSSDIIDRIISEANSDGSRDRTVGIVTVLNFGYFIGEFQGSPQFGHSGGGSVQGLADPQQKLGMSYVSSYSSIFSLTDDPRFTSLQEETYKCIKEPES
ncbi:beta-lactamase domain-containing protein 2-like [Acanthaster planci]|uniref:Beta-lactamase domain-containing protein 2-like n=1 Tax=Acanthaster planci TaxID=133434 RepID=A0A8B7Z0C4_ACAPL|nr:beta-lactamase domain-containing protein 2-like [Acanthaster planci]